MKGYLTTKQLAERWDTHVNSIQRWRTDGAGPKFIRLGLKRILYPLSEIEAYEARTLRSTAEKSVVKNDPGVTRPKKNPR